MPRIGEHAFMRCQTQRNHGTKLLIEEINHAKKSRMKLGKESHAEPRVGHPWPISTPQADKEKVSILLNSNNLLRNSDFSSV